MGNEIYYCIHCGIRVSGAEGGEGWDRTRCGPCQGALPTRIQASTLVRRVSSSASIPVRRPGSGTTPAVPTKSRGTDLRPRKTPQIAVLCGLTVAVVAVAVVFALPGAPVPAPVEAPVPVPAPPPDPLRMEFLKQLDGLREQASTISDPDRGDEMLELLADAVQVSARLAPERRGEILDWQKLFRARYEAMADALVDPIDEAATALADEGRAADALARIQTFPKGLRHSRAWSRLEALARRIQSK